MPGAGEVVILCGAIVGAGSVVTKDVPDFALVAGVPAMQIGWVSQAGNRLVFDEKGEALDPYDNSRYRLSGGRLMIL